LDTFYLITFLSDGIEVSPQLIGPDKLEWRPSYPETNDVDKQCVAWTGQGGSLWMWNTKCDSSEDRVPNGQKKFYDKTSGDAFDNSLLLRGYLCEARAIHTITAYEREVKSFLSFIHTHSL
jgi:hypothetical protein